MICDTRYKLFYFQYHETLQDMRIYIIDLTKHMSPDTLVMHKHEFR